MASAKHKKGTRKKAADKAKIRSRKNTKNS
jgi:hypothetical protein